MLHEGKIWMGTGVNGPVYLLPSMANRHGLIAGATGTGKTVSLKVLAEGFSDLGVPVFLSDIKSDLSGMVRAGASSGAIEKRLAGCGVDPERFLYHGYPTSFWDVYGEHGKHVYATVKDMGAPLLSRMLQLNDTQTGVMNIVYRYCNDQGIPLNSLYELKRALAFIGEHAKDFTIEYGNVSVNSVGAIQRAVAMLEDQGGDIFFTAPTLDIRQWLQQDPVTGQGVINILSADRLFNNPIMYSTFLLWMLTKLYDLLPERGDAEKPVVVFFFDEAHLLFDDCSRTLMDKIEQVVRLIRSKGVGVYFITQSPTDIPMPVLGQLGNRIQHALRAYTPLDQKAVRVAAQTFRENPDFDTEEAITALKTGEALMSFLDENGAPGVVERATVLPPQSHMGAVSESERKDTFPRPAAQVAAKPGFAPAAAFTQPQGVVFPEAPAYGEQSPEEFFSPRQETDEVPVITVGADATPSDTTVSFTTPQPARVSAVQNAMSQTFKVFDPTTGQYVEKELPQMTQAPDPQPAPQQAYVPQAAPQQAYVPQAAPQQAYAPQAAPQQGYAPQQAYVPQQAYAPQPYVPQPMTVAQPGVMTTADAQGAVQQVPTIQVQPAVQQMPVMVFDPTTGQYIQQLMTMQQDPTTGNWVAVQPQAPVDPITLAEQKKAAEKAAKEAEKAAKEAARAAKEKEAAERRARSDELREEAAERARRNDSIAGRIKNTAISTATRQVTSSLTKGITNAINDLLGGNKK